MNLQQDGIQSWLLARFRKLEQLRESQHVAEPAQKIEASVGWKEQHSRLGIVVEALADYFGALVGYAERVAGFVGDAAECFGVVWVGCFEDGEQRAEAKALLLAGNKSHRPLLR